MDERDEPKTGIALSGLRVLLTGSAHLNRSFAQLIEQESGEPITLPFIRTTSVTPPLSVMNQVAEQQYYAVVFTSKNAVESFFKAFGHLQEKVFAPPIKILSVGKKTTESLLNHGVNVDFTAKIHSMEGLLEEYDFTVTGQKILYPAGNLAGETLRSRLSTIGVETDQVIVYKTETQEKALHQYSELIQNSPPDWIILSSPSSVRVFIQFQHTAPISPLITKIAVIGSRTEEQLRESGVTPHCSPRTSTAESVVEAIAAFENFPR